MENNDVSHPVLLVDDELELEPDHVGEFVFAVVEEEVTTEDGSMVDGYFEDITPESSPEPEELRYQPRQPSSPNGQSSSWAWAPAPADPAGCVLPSSSPSNSSSSSILPSPALALTLLNTDKDKATTSTSSFGFGLATDKERGAKILAFQNKQMEQQLLAYERNEQKLRSKIKKLELQEKARAEAIGSGQRNFQNLGKLLDKVTEALVAKNNSSGMVTDSAGDKLVVAEPKAAVAAGAGAGEDLDPALLLDLDTPPLLPVKHAMGKLETVKQMMDTQTKQAHSLIRLGSLAVTAPAASGSAMASAADAATTTNPAAATATVADAAAEILEENEKLAQQFLAARQTFCRRYLEFGLLAESLHSKENRLRELAKEIEEAEAEKAEQLAEKVELVKIQEVLSTVKFEK